MNWDKIVNSDGIWYRYLSYDDRDMPFATIRAWNDRWDHFTPTVWVVYFWLTPEERSRMYPIRYGSNKSLEDIKTEIELLVGEYMVE